MKEILITKERNNEKFQEFRKMILENLAIVLKIICGDKFLIHKFDTNDYMDYEPKFVTKEEYAMNMVERDLHEVYNIMTQGYTEVCNGGSIEKIDLTHKYNVSTIISTDDNTRKEIKTHTEIKMKDGKEEMIRNIRVLEESVEMGLLEGYALESAKQILEKIEHRTTGVDTWVLENNEGTYGTEIVITKEGHIDLYLCIMEKYASKVSYIRVGNFQPEFGLGDVYLPNGKVKEYQKLGTIINALNKEYEKYGFYFTADTKNNRRILSESRAIYELYIVEEKENKRKENLMKDIVALSNGTLATLLKELEHEGDVTYTDTEKLQRELVEFYEESDKKYDCWQDVFEEYKKTIQSEKKTGFEVRIVEISTGEVVNTMNASNIRIAEKIESGILINLNKDEYYVEIVDLSQTKTPTEEPVKKSTKQTLEIVNNDFDNLWTCVLEKSIKKVAFKKESGLTGKIEIVDLELGRIYFVNSFGEDCTLRMWNYYEVKNGKQLRVEWTMYRHIDGEGTEDLGEGITLVNFKDVPELSQEKKERMEKLSKISKLAMEFLDMEKEEVAKLLETIDEPVEYAEDTRFLAGFHLETNGIVHREEIGANGETVEQVWDIMKDEIKTYVVKRVEELGIKIEKPKKKVNKSEDKQMNTINKNALTNRMNKLGEFLKENRDKDAVENKVYELFPKAMEVEVFEDDNVVHFLVGQDYVGKSPTRKEMKYLDYSYYNIEKIYGLSIYISVCKEKIKMDATVGVDYRDKHLHYHYTDFTLKEIEIECNPEQEETDELEKNIKDHIHEVVDLLIRENHGVGYMYKKTIAVKKNDGYELTSSFEDMWTGKNVYIGNDSNMLMILNSEKSFLTDIVEKFLGSHIGISETVEKIKEKIKRKFEYSYSKSITVKEEEEIYVLETPSGVELFWYYKDAYSRMVELVNEMSERFSNNYEVIIEDYSARMETFSWKITTKKIK